MLNNSQVINNIIDSIAKEQEFLSKIIEAESNKITVATEKCSECSDLICINKSVESMLDTITKLEIVLQSKIKLINSFYDCE